MLSLPSMRAMWIWVFIAQLASAAFPAIGAEPSYTETLRALDTGPLAVVEAGVTDSVLEVTLEGKPDHLRGRDQSRENLVARLLWAARTVNPDLRGIQVYLQTGPGVRELLSEMLRDPTEAARVRLIRSLPGPRPLGLPPQELPFGGGSLQGKTIVLSPGHGFAYYDALNDWSFQRGSYNLPGCDSCLGVLEDLSNAQMVARHLIPHLLRAGAAVWEVRERDLSQMETVLDEDAEGVIQEGAWAAGTSPGGYLDDYRVLQASNAGRVVYPLDPQKEDDYWVSVWYVAGTNRVSDAVFRITYLGGVAEHHLDQTRNGSRWIHLGAYRFAPGGSSRLQISSGPAAEPDKYLIADAVRLGGGFDQTNILGKSADKPRWMMSALQYLRYLGLPGTVDTGSDATVRPTFAEWQGANAFISLHSNATGTVNNLSGSSTYRFNCLSYPDHSAAPDPALCDQPPGSDALQRAVHVSMVNVLREQWDPNWVDRGPLVANFGELRPLQGIPGVLVEAAFHDGTEKASPEMRMPDNQALQDPRFLSLLGYAWYAGLAQFFNPQVTLLPDREPQGLHLVHGADGGLLAGWDPLETALAYRVRQAVDGLGLGEGLVTEGTSVLIEGFEPGQLVAVRVSGLNAGGEGPPSELAVARYRGNGTFADLLLVSGFDRQDAAIGDGFNRRDQAWAHADAIVSIADRNLYFDFASNESVAAGTVPLSAYRAVVWILGEESAADETFSAEEQRLALDHLNGDRALMATGAEIGLDLVEQGSPADTGFLEVAFGALYLRDDAGCSRAYGVGSFAGVGDLPFDDGSLGIYPVEHPDVFEAILGEVVLAYETGEGAAVGYKRQPGRSLLAGFPMETIGSAEARSRWMNAALSFLMPDHTPDDFDSDGLPDDWEYQNRTDPQRPSADADPDGDGRSNLQEYQEGTDPQRADGLDGSDGGTNPEGDADASQDQDDTNQDGDDGGPPKKIHPGCACGGDVRDPGAGLVFWLGLLGLTRLRRLSKLGVGSP